MNKLLVNTPQNVKFEYNMASLGSRMVAFGIDYFLIIGYMIFAYYFLDALGLFSVSVDKWLTTGLYMLVLLPGMFYPFLMETFFRGQTVGKMIVKIKVVRTDGTRATIYQYFVRWLCSIVDIFLCFGALGISSIVVTKNAQRIGDIAAETAVINTKQQASIRQTLFTEITRAHVVTFPQVMNLSDRDANTIKDIFRKSYERRDYNIILALSARLSELLDARPLPNMRPEAFIDTVIKDYYYTFQN